MKRKNILIPAIAAALLVLPMAAFAQVRDVGDIAADLTDQTGFVSQLVTVVAFVLGVGMAIAGLLKFKAHSQNPNDPSAKMSTAFMLVFVGAALVAIPAALGSGIQTIFGNSAQKTDASTGFNRVN